MSDGIGQESKPEKREQIGNAELERRIQLMQNQLEAAQTKTDLIAAMEAEITRLRAQLAETRKREQELLSERKGEGVRTRRAIAEAKKKWLAEAEGVSYRYRCHNCGSHTPPPEPFKFYVTCKDCGVSTATTAAEEAHPAPAKVPEVNFDDVPVSVKELTPEAAWICGYYAYREAMLEAQGGE